MNIRLRRASRAILYIVSISSFTCSAQAADDGWTQLVATWQQGAQRHLLEIDNDSLLLNKVDGLYSSGARWRVQAARRQGQIWRMTEWSLGHQMYTPLDIKLPPAAVRAPDRPYAAWLYTRVGHQGQMADGSGFGYGLSWGCLGPCAGGEKVQTRLHRLLRQPEPQAWSRQMRQEWGLVADAQWQFARSVLGPNADWQSSAGLRLGNIHSDANLGGIFRFGRLNRLPDEPALYAYLDGAAHLVARDATLQGGVWRHDNPHTVKPQRWQGRLALGLEWQGERWSANLALQRRSNAVQGLPAEQGRQTVVMLGLAYRP
ncbi:lipid A-modifier LpxR family protein [Massilia sp. W12]|uniref:lipid A-modifier LpxR family protein n=1 Tax=Massilia sp. W12 TaxID=3126507 RepID=UPI0030CBAF78